MKTGTSSVTSSGSSPQQLGHDVIVSDDDNGHGALSAETLEDTAEADGSLTVNFTTAVTAATYPIARADASFGALGTNDHQGAGAGAGAGSDNGDQGLINGPADDDGPRRLWDEPTKISKFCIPISATVLIACFTFFQENFTKARTGPFSRLMPVEGTIEVLAIVLMVLGMFLEPTWSIISRWFHRVGHVSCLAGVLLMPSPLLPLPPIWSWVPAFVLLVVLCVVMAFNA